MRTYTITKKMGEIDWNKIPTLSIDNPCQTEGVNISAGGQLCYDEEFLYIRLFAKEEHIRAEYTGLLDAPCEDSCLEFFFSPMEGDSRYFNIEFNPNCCVYFGMGSCVKDLVRLIPDAGFPFEPKAVRTTDGWEITYRVPYSLILCFFPEFAPVSGGHMRANFYKCGDLTVKEHYFSWNKITGEVLSFHRPCDFGLLTFE